MGALEGVPTVARSGDGLFKSNLKAAELRQGLWVNIYRKLNREKDIMTDRRRYDVIETVSRSSNCYWLTINGVMWAEVEWSPKRRAWCIQDAAGHCLLHIEHIVGENPDVGKALRIARRMIVDGTLPTPEEARAQLCAEQDRARLGTPIIGDITAQSEAVPVERKQ
jgi:hypothetical protein